MGEQLYLEFPGEQPVAPAPAPVHRVLWRSRLTMLLVVLLGTLAVSYRIARFQVGRSFDDMDNGTELLQQNRYAAAIDMFDRAIDRNGELTLAWTGKGLSLLYLGRYEEALDQYEQALAIDPALSIAWYGRGVSLVKLGRYRDALTCFDHILQLHPRDRYAARLRERVLDLMRQKPRHAPLA